MMELQSYNYTIQHRPEKYNANADALSKINDKQLEEEEDICEIFMVSICDKESEIEWHFLTKKYLTFNPEELQFERQLQQQFANELLITTVGYQSPKNELEDIYHEYIKVKQVIARQPIIKRGSQCTFNCDTENDHIHTYCKACKKNLPIGQLFIIVSKDMD